jgi:hypothetical protein
MLSHWGNDLALIVNSRQFGDFGSREPLFGLPFLCQGPIQATVYILDAGTFEVLNRVTLDDFQASTATDGPSGLTIGGETRASCEDGGKAALVRITQQLSASQIWKDDDQFPSTVQSITEENDNTLFAVKRQRPIGVRRLGALAPAAASKRWGDDGDELLEFSIFQMGGDNNPRSKYDSSFGISAFVQGLVLDRGKPVMYGSLGGRAAISFQQ